ncbi:RTA1-domain-containing protein [Penicillium hispanicum]|uniref:RTA1-domain-containing protein n=1 Tax=Penicillium hispanicum TaxID=1080232 RepID=UPI00253F9B3D|nr:RTA1-domain-containing protein [Penicillium hispanicum]KAJ5591562.1 RTA1-domain-containing protein [Penicillium hispanicum]
MSTSPDDSLYVGCKAYQEAYSTSYGYIPSEAAGIAFCVLFGLSMTAHTVQFCWKRTWWCCLFSIGCLGELIGWAGRTWSAECPYNSNAFMIQISTLIIGAYKPIQIHAPWSIANLRPRTTAPVFFTGGIYVLLGRFIQLFGRECSMLTPKLYVWIFCTCDVVSLIVQAVGGGMASSESNDTNGDTAVGTNIMVAGVVIQLISISVFVFFAVDFARRSARLGYLQPALKGPIGTLMGTMVLSVVCIYIRSIYRTIELAQGWTGYLITHESYFIGLDGVMMVIAVGVFNICHPGWLLPSELGIGLPKYQKTMELSNSNEGLNQETQYTGFGNR